MSPENEAPENLEITVPRKQRFKPSVLEVMIGILILLGIMYLAYLVLYKETGETRGLESRIKTLESRIDQRGLALEKGLEGVKESSRQLEARLKALEDHRKQVDSRLEGLAKVATAPPKVAMEDKKPAASGPGKEKIIHKVKKGETLMVIAKKYRVSTQDIIQWNKLPQGKAIRPDEKLIIYIKK